MLEQTRIYYGGPKQRLGNLPTANGKKSRFSQPQQDVLIEALFVQAGDQNFDSLLLYGVSQG